MLRYAITSRALYSGGESEKRAALLNQASRWAADGIDFIQLREKDLPAAEITSMARQILAIVASASDATKLVVNSRPDIALATGAHGVHLTSDPNELRPAQVRALYASANGPALVITVSCHTLDEVLRAREERVDAILFSPVFEKKIPGQPDIPGQGLVQLHAACTAVTPTPVYALGGVTLANASSCLKAGAAGIAGIRFFYDS